MSVHALAIGTLFRAAESKVSKGGKSFVATTLKTNSGNATEWIKILTFSESAMAELLRLAAGDSVSIQGTLKAELYERDGVSRVSITIFADLVLALKQPPKQRKKADPPPPEQRHSRRRAEPEQSGSRTYGDSGDDQFGDEIPF